MLTDSPSIPGITTWANAGEGVWLREERTGKTVMAGRFDPALPGPYNRMRPVEEGFAGLGVGALFGCMEANGDWAAIDEIGYLECGCPQYCDAVRLLMGKKRLLAAVRRQDLPFLEELCGRPDAFCVDLDRPYGKLGCVIMASGLGRRFGGNKLLEEFGGKPLFLRALEATEGIFAARAAVTRHREVEELCRGRNVPAVLHDLPCRSDTVRLGLEAVAGPGLPGGIEGCLFCPADQPLLRRETVASLALCAAAGPEWIWRAAWKGREGAPALFPSWAFAELRTLPEGGGGRVLMERFRHRVRPVQVREEAELWDVDSREDLERLKLHRKTSRMG